MRKVLSLILVSLLVVGTVYALQPGYRKDPGIGDIRKPGVYQSDAHKTFRMVRYVPSGIVERRVGSLTETNKLTQDCLVSWSITADDGVTITEPMITQDSAVAGILVHDVLTPFAGTEGQSAVQDRGNQNWSWLQTFGPSEVSMGNGFQAKPGDALGTCDFRSPCEAKRFSIVEVIAPLGIGNVGLQTLSDDSRMLGNAGFFLDAGLSNEDNVAVFIRTE